MKKLLFVYNPNAGKGIVKSKIGEIVDVFIKGGYLPTVYATQARKDGYKIIREQSEDYDLIVCSGGDGTLDEVVTAIIDEEIKCPLGYIPSGSTNDFARSLGISRDILEATEDIVSGNTFQCDVGKFNGDIFVYIAAFGMFTDVSYATPQDMKNVLGHMAYVLEGVKRIYNIPGYEMTITYDSAEPIEGRFMYGMVTNSRTVGGFKTISGRNVIFDDGEFEVTLFRKPQSLAEVQEVITSLLNGQIDSHYMISFKAGHVSFECAEEIPWTLDGEFGGEHEKVEIHNLNKALTICVPLEIDESELEWADLEDAGFVS